MTALDVQGTPTLLLVNGRGTVQKAWVGQLPPAQEKDVLASMSKAAMPEVLPDSSYFADRAQSAYCRYCPIDDARLYFPPSTGGDLRDRHPAGTRRGAARASIAR